MTSALLTPAEVLAHFHRERHWLAQARQRGLIEAVNIGGQGRGARYRYRLKDLQPQPQEPSDEELLLADLMRRCGR